MTQDDDAQTGRGAAEERSATPMTETEAEANRRPPSQSADEAGMAGGSSGGSGGGSTTAGHPDAAD